MTDHNGALSSNNAVRGDLERAISHALEQPPVVSVPADFAARVAACAAAMPQRKPAQAARYARIVGIIAATLLLLALFVLAPFAAPRYTSTGFLLEMAVLLQLCALVYWLMRTPREVP